MRVSTARPGPGAGPRCGEGCCVGGDAADGVDRTIKYQAKPGAAVKRKKQYAQVKPYFNY